MLLAPRSLTVIATLGLTFVVMPIEHSKALTPLIADEHGLVNIYLEKTYEDTSQVCSRRFPDLAVPMRDGLRGWRTRHAGTLVEMARLHADLYQAARASPSINGLLNPDRLDRLAMLPANNELYNLAGAVDTQARQLCDKRRTDLDDDDQTRILFTTARQTAQDLLTKKRRDTEEYERRQRQWP